MIALEQDWVWDSWYAHDGERWHAFFLKAPKRLGDPELRHINASFGHAVSDDLRTWDYLGTCFAPTSGPTWDDCATWTGSVVRGDDQCWHLFYTGLSKAEDALYQRIGHAVSDDLHHWRRVGSGLCLDLKGPHADRYEVDLTRGHWHDRAMRDPWVMRDPAGNGWVMAFTARIAGVAEPNGGGAIGFATSPDLQTWTLQPPVFAGGFGQLEVPQVFERAGRWYCLFCTAAEHFSKASAEGTPGGPVTGTHYLIGEGPRGPWRVAPGAFLDGALPSRRYAGRILDTGAGLALIGFADRPGSTFQGYIMDPQPVAIDATGQLHLKVMSQAAE